MVDEPQMTTSDIDLGAQRAVERGLPDLAWVRLFNQHIEAENYQALESVPSHYWNACVINDAIHSPRMLSFAIEHGFDLKALHLNKDGSTGLFSDNLSQRMQESSDQMKEILAVANDCFSIPDDSLTENDHKDRQTVLQLVHDQMNDIMDLNDMMRLTYEEGVKQGVYFDTRAFSAEMGGLEVCMAAVDPLMARKASDYDVTERDAEGVFVTRFHGFYTYASALEKQICSLATLKKASAPIQDSKEKTTSQEGSSHPETAGTAAKLRACQEQPNVAQPADNAQKRGSVSETIRDKGKGAAVSKSPATKTNSPRKLKKNGRT